MPIWIRLFYQNGSFIFCTRNGASILVKAMEPYGRESF